VRGREAEGERGGRRRNEKQKKNVREAGKGVKAEKERREEVKKARDNFGETFEATDLDRIRKEEEAPYRCSIQSPFSLAVGRQSEIWIGLLNPHLQ